jgi:hypothetical protein
MWRCGLDGERSLCNACGVRIRRSSVTTEVVNKPKTNALARRGGAKVPKKPRTWIRPSRSRAAVAERERVLEQRDKLLWEPEDFCWDKEYDIGIFFNDEGLEGFADNDLSDLYVRQDLRELDDLDGLDALDGLDGLDGMDDLGDLDDLNDLDDLDDLEYLEDLEDLGDHQDLRDDMIHDWESFTMEEYVQEKRDESVPLSPRTPLGLMMVCA